MLGCPAGLYIDIGCAGGVPAHQPADLSVDTDRGDARAEVAFHVSGQM